MHVVNDITEGKKESSRVSSEEEEKGAVSCRRQGIMGFLYGFCMLHSI